MSLQGRVEPLIDKDLETTAAFGTLLRTIEQYPPQDLIIVDTRSRFSNVDENSNAAVAREICLYEQMAKSAKGAAIMIVHHTSKMVLRAITQGDYKVDQTTARGASAFTDNARLVIDMAQMPIKETAIPIVRLSVTKCNYGPLPRKSFYLMFDHNGLYQLVSEEDAFAEIVRDAEDADKLLAYLSKISVPTTASAIAGENVFGNRAKVTKLIHNLVSRDLITIDDRGNKKLISVVPPTVVTALSE